jgi:PAS domain S-box-containing protein
MSDASPLGILVSDADGRCVCNAAYQKIVGLGPEQACAPDGSVCCTGGSPADVGGLAGRSGGPEPFVAEVRLLRADGHVAWVRLNAAAMLDGTGCRGMLTVEDITLRKDADAVLRAPRRPCSPRSAPR